MTTNNGLNNIINTLSKIKYNSYAHIQLSSIVKLNFNIKNPPYSKLFKELIVHIKDIKNKLPHTKKQIPNKKTYNPNKNITIHKYNIPDHHKSDIKKDQVKKEQIKKEYIKEEKIIDTFTGIIKDNLVQISISKKSSDFYSQIFFRAINNGLDVFTDMEIKNYLKKIKYRVVESFYIRDLYKRLDYSSKDFKKNELDNVFANNLPISLHMLRVYGDVFNVNIVYIHMDGAFTFLTFYDLQKTTVIITEDEHTIYSIRSKTDTFIRGKEFCKYLYDKHTYNKAELDKFTISTLQNICKLRMVNYKKMGKTKRINRTKEELISEIFKF